MVAAVELRVEQGLPKALDDAPAGRPTEPLEQRDLVQVLVGLLQLATGRKSAKAQAIGKREEREREELAAARSSRPAAVAVDADLRGPESEGVAEPELVGEADHAVVGGKHDVVEAIDVMAVEVERADEASQARRARTPRPGRRPGRAGTQP